MKGKSSFDDSLPPPQMHTGEEPKGKFEYLAMDQDGREMRGTIDAADETEAVAKLKIQNLFPIEVWTNKAKARPVKKAKAAAKTGLGKREQKAVTTKSGLSKRISDAIGLGDVIKVKQLCIMTRQLATMLDAGLPLLLSLRTLEEQCGKGFRNRPMKRILHDLVMKVESGMSLSEALAFHPKSFSRLYVGLIRAGEASGAMEEVLGRLAEYIEKSERMKKKIKGGMTYPTVVLVIAGGITFGLMVGVVPKFAEMFDEILEGIPLPLLTQWVIAISDVLMHNFGLVVGGFFGFVIFAKTFLKTKVGSYMFDWWMVTMPPFKGLVVKIAVGRFCSTLGTLLDAGVPILDALNIVRETSTNVLMATTVQKIYTAVGEGEKIATQIEHARLFPGMVVRMIDIGEQTGALPDMLKRIARTYDEEVETALEAMISLIEPFMICFLAVVVGGIVMALFLPLIKIIESLGV